METGQHLKEVDARGFFTADSSWQAGEVPGDIRPLLADFALDMLQGTQALWQSESRWISKHLDGSQSSVPEIRGAWSAKVLGLFEGEMFPVVQTLNATFNLCGLDAWSVAQSRPDDSLLLVGAGREVVLGAPLELPYDRLVELLHRVGMEIARQQLPSAELRPDPFSQLLVRGIGLAFAFLGLDKDWLMSQLRLKKAVVAEVRKYLVPIRLLDVRAKCVDVLVDGEVSGFTEEIVGQVFAPLLLRMPATTPDPSAVIVELIAAGAIRATTRWHLVRTAFSFRFLGELMERIPEVAAVEGSLAALERLCGHPPTPNDVALNLAMI